MLNYVLGRLLTFIPTFIGVTLISFGFIRALPGDPIQVMAGERGISDERYAQLAKQFGYDQPIYVQFWDYLTGVLQGDLGNSFVTKRPVFDEFFTLFPATLELAVCAMIFAIALGLPAGVIAAVNRGKFFDRALMSTALVGYSMPIFWWALLLIIVFSGNLQWTPVSGRIDLLYYFPNPTGFMLIDSLASGQKGAFLSAVRHLVLPTIVLGTIPLAVIARQTRSAMLEVLGEDYIRTARAKGLTRKQALWRHAVRNALIPVLTIIGLQFSFLLAGGIIIEQVFFLPGLGRLIFQSISGRDLIVVESVVMLLVFVVIVVNFAVDIAYGAVDPRLRSKS